MPMIPMKPMSTESWRMPQRTAPPDVWSVVILFNEQNKQSYPMFIMNQDGFTLLAMGFNGKKAMELSNMNLGHVDMVVMSACESGLGETSGEGVFGLQRGFKLAGANTLLMSLWKVDDAATQILMTEFYRNYLSGKTKTSI